MCEDINDVSIFHLFVPVIDQDTTPLREKETVGLLKSNPFDIGKVQRWGKHCTVIYGLRHLLNVGTSQALDSNGICKLLLV